MEAQAPRGAAAIGLLTYCSDHVLCPEVGHRDAQRHLIEPHLPALRHDAHIAAAAQQPWLQQLVVNAGAHTGPLGLRRLTAPLHVPRCRFHMTQSLTRVVRQVTHPLGSSATSCTRLRQ